MAAVVPDQKAKYGVVGAENQQMADIQTQQPAPGQGFTQQVTPGLEYLLQVDQLVIQQKIEICEILTGCEMKNRYVIKNSMGQEVYNCREESDCLERQCCGPARSLQLPLIDGRGQEVLRMVRPLACSSFWCVCCTCRDWLQEVFIYSSNTLLGSVHEEYTCCCQPQLTVYNAQKEAVFKVEGPWCACNWCSDVDFPVMSADGSMQVGRIQKQWGGVCREMFTDADKFNVSFPLDLDVNMKAVLLGALFLVDFMYFENNQNNNN